jgi:hypothetical protein
LRVESGPRLMAIDSGVWTLKQHAAVACINSPPHGVNPLLFTFMLQAGKCVHVRRPAHPCNSHRCQLYVAVTGFLFSVLLFVGVLINLFNVVSVTLCSRLLPGLAPGDQPWGLARL